LIYRSMDVINFAQGELAMFTTFIAWQLTQQGLPLWVAFPATIVIAFAGAVALERIVIRPIERAPQLTVVIVTLGLLITFNGLAGWIWGYELKAFPSPFPTAPINVGNVSFSSQDLGVIGVSLGALVLIYLFFARTKLGLAMRAAALYPNESERVARAGRTARLDARARLGAGLGHGNALGPHGRADRVPRPEHDAEHRRLCVRGGGAGRHR